MKNWLYTTLFGLTMALYFFFPWHLIWQQERILSRGERMLFRLAPVDPSDIFRGQYLRLHYQWSSVPNPDTLNVDQVAFVCLHKDSSGMAFPGMAYARKPDDCTYLRTRVVSRGYPQASHVMIEVPGSLRRYYLNERSASEADSVYQQLLRRADLEGSLPAMARVRVRNGKARVEDLLFEGEPLRDYLKR